MQVVFQWDLQMTPSEIWISFRACVGPGAIFYPEVVSSSQRSRDQSIRTSGWSRSRPGEWNPDRRGKRSRGRRNVWQLRSPPVRGYPHPLPPLKLFWTLPTGCQDFWNFEEGWCNLSTFPNPDLLQCRGPDWPVLPRFWVDRRWWVVHQSVQLVTQ